MNLLNLLNTLENSGLINVAQVEPEIEYLFRHVMVQDAAYESLLKQDRKALHLAVGETLERLYPDRLAELAPLLGAHFDEGGDSERAQKYYTLAGDQASRQNANAEAAAHYRSAIKVASRGKPTSEQLNHLYSRLGRVMELLGSYADALKTYKELEALAEQRSDASLRLAALTEQAKLYSVPSSEYAPPKAQAILNDALILAREIKDRPAEARILWSLQLLLMYSGGDPEEAIQYGEQSVAISRELNLRELLAYTLADLCQPLWLSGYVERANASVDEAIQIWRELDNPVMIASSLTVRSYSATLGGNYEEAIRLTDEAFALDSATGNTWGMATSQFMIGTLLADRGDLSEGQRRMEQAVQYAEQITQHGTLVMTQSELAWLYGTLGAVDRAIELAQNIVDFSKDFAVLAPWPMAVLARLYLLKGDIARAEEWTDKAQRAMTVHSPILVPTWNALGGADIAVARKAYSQAIGCVDGIMPLLEKTQIRLYKPDLLYLKGKALLESGDAETGYKVWQAARAEAESLGSQRSLWFILFALSKIEAERGNQAEAESLRQRACETIQFLAEHISDPALHESFLNQPQVRAVLESSGS